MINITGDLLIQFKAYEPSEVPSRYRIVNEWFYRLTPEQANAIILRFINVPRYVGYKYFEKVEDHKTID
jgi:hypothetical protein